MRSRSATVAITTRPMSRPMPSARLTQYRPTVDRMISRRASGGSSTSLSGKIVILTMRFQPDQRSALERSFLHGIHLVAVTQAQRAEHGTLRNLAPGSCLNDLRVDIPELGQPIRCGDPEDRIGNVVENLQSCL